MDRANGRVRYPWHMSAHGRQGSSARRTVPPLPFAWGTRTYVAGIVNCTPDSFSGDGFTDPAAAIAHGLQLVEEGADLLDVGGESTRPGAVPVDEQEELRRVLPVVA